MHLIIEDGLEDYLAGRVLRDFEVHLQQCESCRSELEQLTAVSTLFREAFVPAAIDLAPSSHFYARLSESIELRKTPSIWSFFNIDAVFGRRVAFASLLALALVGSFLVSRESDVVLTLHGPEAMIAEQDIAPQNATEDRERMLVALASYER